MFIEVALLDSDVTPESCYNTGPACLSCPCFEQCDHHYDPENDDA